MKPAFIGSVVVVAFIGILIISGCISHKEATTSSPAIGVQSPAPNTASVDSFWIKIDPIRDFATDSSLNITGSSILNISGTTNYPAGSTLYSEIIGYNGERIVWRTSLEVRGNNTGPNPFSFEYDMKGNPPGRYQVSISDRFYNTPQVISRFNILSGDNTPHSASYTWIDMNPMPSSQKGKTMLISGSTNLPAGTEITVGYSALAHSCTPAPTPDKPGTRTICGGSCRTGEGSSYKVRVVAGIEGINSWNVSVNTTGLCVAIYDIGIEAGNGTDTQHAGQSIWVFPE